MNELFDLIVNAQNAKIELLEELYHRQLDVDNLKRIIGNLDVPPIYDKSGG